MEVVLALGDTLKVLLKDTDGEFTLTYGRNAVRIQSDLPDTTGRKGIIYEEKFGPTPTDKSDDPWAAQPVAVPNGKGKLIPTHNAVRAWVDFISAVQFSLVRPTQSGTSGNLPDLDTFAACPANTIVVLFEGRLRPGGLVPSAKHNFVKSKGYWWPQPENEPHNYYTNGTLEKFIAEMDLGFGIFHPGK